MQPHRTFPLALGMALLLCAKLASPADAAPKVVLQIGHQAPVRAVLWTTDSRRLFTLAEDGSIVVWDVTRNVPGGVIIDHARIPWPEGGRVLAFMTNPDGASARITLQLGPAAAATHDINLQTREVTPVPVAASPFPATSLFPPSPDGRWSVEQNHGNGVSGIFSASDENIQFDEADCTSRTRCRYGVNLLGTGQAPVKLALTGNPRSYFLDLDLARDGRRLLRLESIRNETASRVQQLDIDSGAASSFSPDGAFHRVEWLEGERYALFSHGYNVTNDVAQGGLPPAMLVDPACSAAGGKACSRVAAHAMMRPLGTDIFVGAGSLRDCFRAPPAVGDTGPDGVWCLDEDVEDNDGHRKEPRLQVYARGTSKAGTSAWTTRTVAELAGLDITAIEVARDRHSIAIAARSADASSVILMLDASPSVAARVLWRGTAQDDRSIRYLAFDPDGRQLLFDFNGRLTVVDTTGAQAPRQLEIAAPRRIATDGHRALALATGTLVELQTGKTIALPRGDLLRAGFLEGKPVLWTATSDGILQFWHSASGALLLTLYSFTDNRFFALTPDGRYDTNLTPDANEVRWLMADAPWQSLAAQTFMRDYYEPRLLPRMLACTAANNCSGEFRSLPPVGAVNRVLPQVEVSSVTQGAATGTVDVCVAARSMAAETDAGQDRPSGLHNLRLFRDGKLVAERGAAPGDLDPANIDQWRARTSLPDQACPQAGSAFTVAVPQHGRPVTFTAYALNSDRVKGDTSAPVTWQTSARAMPRTPRAYVIAIGVNDYVNIPEKSLQFAVNDAQAVARTLQSIPRHEVVTVQLTSGAGRNQATKAQIHAAVGLLAGQDVAANRTLLESAGIAAAALQRSTPEDVVIITFSGHGVADPQGRFFLLPSDANWRAGDAVPDWASMISSGELTEWLREVDAADIALVIDACHSAASVAAGQFKPGPMGDPGLGQLAYDKGVRILAATQGDDVALEDERLRQGLLTFALTGNGEALGKGGRVTLDAWLRYAARRIPTLAEDVRVGRLDSGAGGTRGFTFLNATPAKKPQVQEPSLFDFTGEPSKVVLRQAAP